MRRPWIALIACAACGRVGFGPTADADPTIDAAASIDAPPDAAPLGPFGTPTVLAPSSATYDDDDPTLTGDLLELYWISTRPGGSSSASIWVAKRAAPTAAWGTPTPVTELNSTTGEDNCSVSLDGLSMWFSSSRGGASSHDLWTSTRPNRATAWTVPVPVSELNTPAEDSGVDVSPSLLRLAIARGIQPNRDVLEATRPTTSSPWSALGSISLNTAADEASPFYVSDLEVWFTSDRAGGAGLSDLYVATRPTVTSPFEAPVPVAGINTANVDDDAWLSPDGHLLVFTSNRGTSYDLYEARR